MGKLTKCEDCNGVVSESAAACPHCGAKVEPKTTTFTRAVALLIGVVVIYAIIGSKDIKPQQSAGLTSDKMADNATMFCAAIKRSGASACEVDFNVTEPSYINATVNIAISTAGDFCNGMAKTARDSGVRLATSSRPWELRIFTPSSVRPAAACTLI